MKSLRINLLFFSIGILGVAIIGKLYFLQVLKGDYYRALAQGQQKIIKEISGERGTIFFNSGQILATNEKGKFLYISPREIKDKEGAARVISEAINLPEDEILEKVKRDNYFELIKKRLTTQEIDSLKKLNPVNLEGIYFGETIFRNYPQGALASQAIGFLNEDGQGQYGIEGYHDLILKGEEKLQEKLKTPWGYLTSLIDERTTGGVDIWLTLDYPIQFMAEQLLKEAQQNREFEEGTIIVIEPNSGKVLVLANFPGFDPNQYSKEENLGIFQNSAIQKIFEPGSVLKPITMAAALNEGKVTPEMTYIDKGFVKIGGYTISNYQKAIYGEASMTKVLEKSINTGAVFVEQQLGHELFLKYLEKFGFFEKTGINLQGEIFSQNLEFKKGYEINFATASFGQGIELTPMQLVRAFSAIANEGKLVKPYIVEKIINGDRIIETQPEIFYNPVISPKTASQVTTMMVSTIENGFGKKAKIAGYYIAGKTGTAQISWSALGEKKPGYSEKTVQSFIGFAPAFEPKFLILVKFTNPKAESSAHSVAPVFQKLAKFIIDYWQIPPDYE